MAILEKREVRTDKAPQPRPFYSQAVTVGNLVYTSGIVGIDPLTNEFVGETVKERTVCSDPRHLSFSQEYLCNNHHRHKRSKISALYWRRRAVTSVKW